MHRVALSAAIILGAVLAAGPGRANTCQAETLACGTRMPIGGYCECVAGGMTQSGTVISAPAPRGKSRATGGGCGAQPNEPGCR